MSFLMPLVGSIVSRLIGDVISTYLLKPQDTEKRFSFIITHFILDPLYEALNHIKSMNDSKRKEQFRHLIITWIRNYEGYLELIPRISTLIASSPLKPSYVKEHDLELIPQAVSMPNPVLSRYLNSVRNTFEEIVKAVEDDDIDKALEITKEMIEKRYQNSDLQISSPLRRLIASEGTKLIHVANELSLSLNDPNDMRTLMNLYSTFIYIVNRVSSAIAIPEILQIIIDMGLAFAKIMPEQITESSKLQNVDELKRRLSMYLRDYLSSIPSKVLEHVKEYESVLPQLARFVEAYFEAHEIIASVFVESTGVYPVIPPR